MDRSAKYSSDKHIDKHSVPSATSNLEMTDKGPLVLLFFDGLEIQAYPHMRRRIYSKLRAFARAQWRVMRGKAPKGGFYIAFELLRDSLKKLGCDVRVNDFAAATARPHYPIGIAGHPSVLERVQLPNPTIFGPGDPGYPDEAGVRCATAVHAPHHPAIAVVRRFLSSLLRG